MSPGRSQRLKPIARVGQPESEPPDYPAEAAEFRRLQRQDERGYVLPDGLIRAKMHADAMRAARRTLAEAPNRGAVGIDSSSWTWLGPGNIGGRIRALVIDPTAPSTWIAGSVGGGIWKSTDAGGNWAPLNDFMANLVVSSLVMQPGAPSTIYAGTGEGFYNVDALQGAGIFKSVDGGATWSQLSSTANSNFYFVNRLAMSPSGVLLAATRLGIFRSTDGGGTFGSALATSDPYGVLDVAFNRADGTKAVASGSNGNTWYSVDGGASWKASTGVPAGGGRVEIAYAPSNPSTVYAVADYRSGSLYKSTDGGVTFTLVSVPAHLASSAGDQGWYDNALWVDPTNANVLVVGGIDLWRSTNGGGSWSQISDWRQAPQSAHADQHAIVSVPNFDGSSVKTVVFTNDGGVFSTADVYSVGSNATYTSGWTAQNHNLGITQFYGAAGNAATGTIIAGAQDNGTVRYTPSGGPQGYGTMRGGDGGYAAADPQDSRYFYGEYVYLQIYRSSDGGQSAGYIYNGIADANKHTGANFIAPFVLDPNTPNTMLAGGVQLWRSTNVKAATPSWTSIKAAGAVPISAIAVASGNSDLCWAGHNNGQVFKSTNCTAATPSWTAVDTNGLPRRMVLRIAIDPNNSSRVYVALGGFTSPNLWRTNNGGSSWAPVSGSGASSLPAAPVHDLAIAPDNANALYAGTEVGVFTSTDQGASWTVPQDGPANVSVDQLLWLGGKLVGVTHGRGLYSTTPSASVGSCSAISTGAAPVAVPANQPVPAVTVARRAPGLPRNGVWQRQVKPDGSGETWTYNFTISAGGESASVARSSAKAEASAVGGARAVANAPVAVPALSGDGATQAVEKPETRASRATFGGGAVSRSEPAPVAAPGPSKTVGGDTRARPAGPLAPTTGFDEGGSKERAGLPAVGRLIQRRFVVDSDPREPASGIPLGWYEFWSETGWSRIDERGAARLRSRGIPYRRVVPGPLAGIPAAGSGTASRVPQIAAHLASPLPLATATPISAGLSAFDINWGGQHDEVSSVHVFLRLSHAHADQITIWLKAADREAVLWDGRGGGEAEITLDRVLDQELRGASLDVPWTLYASNRDREVAGVLEDFRILVSGNTSRIPDRPPAAVSVDLIARRAYLKTASGGNGDEIPSPAIGQTVFFTFDWQIAGSGGPVTFSQRALLDGVSYCSFSATLDVGSWISWCNTGWAVTAGQHTLEWDLDYTNAVPETDKSNNSAILSFAAAGGLDIAAQRAYMRTAPGGNGSEVSPPALGQTVYFTADFQISGASGDVGVAQRAVIDGSTFCSFTNTLGNGSWIAWCNGGWTATGGSHTLAWDFDYNHQLPIADRSDNSAFATFTVSGLNVFAQRAYLLTDAGNGSEVPAPTLGQTVYLTLDWGVTAADNGVDVPQRALLDGVPYCSFTPNVSTGLWTSWCGTGWVATGGNHTLEWDLDYTNTLVETDKTDNTAITTFATAGTDLVAERAYLRTAAGGGSEVVSPFAGQTMYLTLDWSVVGASGTINVPQRALLDGSTYCSFNPAVTTGGWMSWCTAGWVATPGQHTIEWDLNYDNSITETNYANDTASASFTTTGLDVVARRAYLRTAAGGGTEVTSPSSGQTVFLTLDWSVLGANGTISVPARAILDGAPYCSYIASVTSGDWFSWCTTGWVVTSGSHTLEWDLDYTNSLVETNKTNNTAIGVFATADPDLVAQRAYLRTDSGGLGAEVDPPAVGQTVYFTLDWRFNGSGSIAAVSQRAVLDGTTYCSFSSPAAPGTSWVSWCNAGWMVTSGPHTLRWDLDFGNTVEGPKSSKSAAKPFTAVASGAILDIVAQRSYLRTNLAGGGNEVTVPSIGQTVYFHLDWQVTGSGNAVTVSNRAVLDGNTFCSGSTSAAPGTNLISWCQNGWAAAAGSHSLRWDLDYNNVVSETNKNNDSASVTFTVADSGPTLDIVAARAYLETAAIGGTEVTAPAVGQTVFFFLDWQVNGSGSNVAVSERAVLDGAVFCTGNETMNIGSFTSHCGQGWPVTAGAHTLQWDLNYNNAVAETNTNNNSAVKTFTPRDATPGLDIVALRAYLQTAPGIGGAQVDSPAVSQRVYPSLDWQVLGGAGSLNVTQRASMDGAQLCSCSSPITVGTRYVSSCSQAWNVTGGAHTLRWDLDYNNSINEIDKTNNSATKTFTPVAGQPAASSSPANAPQ